MTSEKRVTTHEQSNCYMRSSSFQIRPTIRIRFQKIESVCNVKLPVGTIKDFLYVLMWMFKQIYKEFKEWATSFHMVLTGTENSKSIDSKKSKLVEVAKTSKPPRTTCTMCGRFYHEKSVCSETSSRYANRTNSPYAGSAAHALLVKATGQKGWIPTPTSKPVPAHHAGTVPTPIDYGVGEYLFQTVDRGF